MGDSDPSSEESQRPSQNSQLSQLSQLSRGSITGGRSAIIPESAIYLSGIIVAVVILGVISVSAYAFKASNFPYVNSTRDEEEMVVAGDGSIGATSDAAGERPSLGLGVRDESNRGDRMKGTDSHATTHARTTRRKLSSRRQTKRKTTTTSESTSDTTEEDSPSPKVTTTTETDDDDDDNDRTTTRKAKITREQTTGAISVQQANGSVYSEGTPSLPQSTAPKPYKPVSQPLLCTVSSLAVEELRYPLEYCSHLVYTHAHYDLDKHVFTAPMASLSFNTFLKSNQKAETREANSGTRSLYMVSLPGSFLEQVRSRIEKKMAVTTAAMAAWLETEGLAGLALVEQTLTPENVNFYIEFTKALRKAMPHRMQLILGFSSAFLRLLKKEIATLANDLDYLILETHVKEFPEQCLAMFPTAFNASRNPKVLQLKKNLFPRKALDLKSELVPESSKTCISILMAVLMYVVPQGLLHAPSQDCVDFSWATYSEVCHQKKEFKYYEWAEAVIQSIQSRMYMFDDDTTVVNKVKKVLRLSPKTCIALYRTDLDDYSGTCNKGRPFVRVAAVRRAVGL
ncbi:uncharacterized protein LOC135396592 isoform X2 [Ornithodoros turicata]|uniref:uncharacterized protein LOC135396592 isoform X2 n=1 Tax=Ornithodoros turicata TaxID=34597 RepID=UPI003139B0E3